MSVSAITNTAATETAAKTAAPAKPKAAEAVKPAGTEEAAKTAAPAPAPAPVATKPLPSNSTFSMSA